MPIYRTKQAPKDIIECRFSGIAIRQHYAKLKAGRKVQAEFNDVPKWAKQLAGKVDINVAVQELAGNYDKFYK